MRCSPVPLAGNGWSHGATCSPLATWLPGMFVLHDANQPVPRRDASAYGAHGRDSQGCSHQDVHEPVQSMRLKVGHRESTVVFGRRLVIHDQSVCKPRAGEPIGHASKQGSDSTSTPIDSNRTEIDSDQRVERFVGCIIVEDRSGLCLCVRVRGRA